LGAKIPSSEKTEPSATGAENKQGECPFKEGKKTEMPKPAAPEEPELIESDVELDNTGVIEPDNDPPQEMGDPEKMEVTEEEDEKCIELKQEAQIAFSDGNYEKAAELYTEAIKLNPQSALVFAKRANCYIHMNKPNASIRDCDQAIKINPNSATAHKFRGRAKR